MDTLFNYSKNSQAAVKTCHTQSLRNL